MSYCNWQSKSKIKIDNFRGYIVFVTSFSQNTTAQFQLFCPTAPFPKNVKNIDILTHVWLWVVTPVWGVCRAVTPEALIKRILEAMDTLDCCLFFEIEENRTTEIRGEVAKSKVLSNQFKKNTRTSKMICLCPEGRTPRRCQPGLGSPRGRNHWDLTFLATHWSDQLCKCHPDRRTSDIDRHMFRNCFSARWKIIIDIGKENALRHKTIRIYRKESDSPTFPPGRPQPHPPCGGGDCRCHQRWGSWWPPSWTGSHCLP